MIKNKKAVSSVITILIIIALVLVAIGIVWYVVNNILGTSKKEALQGTGDIFNDCVAAGGIVSTETATCPSGKEKRIIGAQYCCITPTP